jgi:transaldolase
MGKNMQFFIDTADIEQIKTAAETGLIDGVTTNPSLIAASGADFKTRIREICDVISGDVSAEVASTDYDNMMHEADILAKIAKNVVIKLPLTRDGLRACYTLSQKNIKTNVTLCFSANQALLAAKAGATYISPFVGRLDDIGHDGMELIHDIREIYGNYGFETKILAASLRHCGHVREAALAGADVATIPTSVFNQLYMHTLTDKGLAAFDKDWEQSGQKI